MPSSAGCSLPDWPWSSSLSGCWSRIGPLMKALAFFALVLCACSACEPGTPNTCAKTASGDVVDGCGPAFDGGTGAQAGTPDAGVVPQGTVGADGGTADRLWFATTG